MRRTSCSTGNLVAYQQVELRANHLRGRLDPRALLDFNHDDPSDRDFSILGMAGESGARLYDGRIAFRRQEMRPTLLVALMLCVTAAGWSQTAQPTQSYPAHLPYRFSNFAWWSDDDLRLLLKNRIPGLGDEIAPTSAGEGKVREALKALLREKQIVAEVQSEEPSPSAISAERVPGAPEPAVVFSILTPEVVVDKVVVLGCNGSRSFNQRVSSTERGAAIFR